MATSPMSSMLKRLRATLRPATLAGETDEQLLHHFVTCRDEEAFAVLVRRHGPMVMGVGLRVARNREDAVDAFQATFLILARKASAIAARALLANWLYGVARNTALKARPTTYKRRLREHQVVEMPDLAMPVQESWTDLCGLLDEELSRLPAVHRVPIVLCYMVPSTALSMDAYRCKPSQSHLARVPPPFRKPFGRGFRNPFTDQFLRNHDRPQSGMDQKPQARGNRWNSFHSPTPTPPRTNFPRWNFWPGKDLKHSFRMVP